MRHCITIAFLHTCEFFFFFFLMKCRIYIQRMTIKLMIDRLLYIVFPGVNACAVGWGGLLETITKFHCVYYCITQISCF